MTTKTKILIGILVVGIILVIGFLVHRIYFYHPEPLRGIPQDLNIKMEVRGTYSPSSYLLEVKNDGSITYEETEGLGMEVKEKRVGKINEKKLLEIYYSFYDKNFFAWDGKYFNDPSKPRDLVVTTIILYFDGKTYTVEEYAGSGPEALHEIEKNLWDLKEDLEEEANSHI